MSHPVRLSRTRRLGFTLIELMVTVAGVAIMAAIAYPSYSAAVAKGKRTDGKQALVELAQRMERYYSERGTYAGAKLGNGGLYAATSSSGNYALAIVSQTADAFVISATPQASMSGDACGTYRYNQLGSASVTNNTLPLEKCW